MKLLIVEDSKLLVDRLKAILSENPDIEIVGTASGPQKALGLYESLKPEVVVLDIRLQGGTGWDALVALKKNPFPPTVIILTNFPSVFHRRKALRGGADHFLDKSQEFERLPGLLKELVSRGTAGLGTALGEKKDRP